ncbi:MAG: DUF6642 family protein [Bacteroidales bacterium]
MKKIFCIESDWEDKSKKEKSILPLLECIKGVYPDFDFIYRTANTKEEYIYCLSRFKKLITPKNDFHLVLFCGHGRSGKISIGNSKESKEYSIKEIGEMCQEVAPQLLKNHMVHFDSCRILSTSESRLNEFMEMTGAIAVSGFSKNVDFIESYALEMILFETLLNERDSKKALNKFFKKHENGLCSMNKFTFIHR